ncbi:MAG: polyphenol oxidase family protein, partial [Candidatus Syntrophosphaera sp.]|nr:polyphenol oxidase family protein [Candidatus Syntrophosphaera sp.]
THSDRVHICSEDDCGAGFWSHAQIPDTDGLLTNLPGQYLLIRTADCTPVLLLDKGCRAVGAVHSGREGTRKNIVGKAARLMQSRYGIQADDIIAHVGAGICHRHYQVDEKTWHSYNSSMREQGFYPNLDLHRHIDIRRGIFQQLIAAGIPFKNIDQECVCTYESPEHFSWRRDCTNNRQINLIGMEHE